LPCDGGCMSDRVLLIDTDLLVLLGASGTLPVVLEVLGFELEQTRRLAAASSQLSRGRRFKETYPGPALQAALRIARTIEPCLDVPREPAWLDALKRVSGIDDGEASFLAILAEHAGWYLTTGDKRALIALARHDDLSEIRERIAGRVICLESLLRMLVRRRGAGVVAEAFAPVRTHKTVGILLSEPQVRSDEVCLAGIDSYLNALKSQVGEGFLWTPPELE
jgi:hypothetical protein